MYTKEEIIKGAKEVHGDKYDYSIVEDIKNKSCKIKYRCKKHNLIHEQTYSNHLQGKGCPECAQENRRLKKLLSKEDFLKKAYKKRNDLDRYDFDKTDFTFRDEYDRMEIYCKEHGRFLIRASHFLNGTGCQRCNGFKKNDEEVRKELTELHPNLDFSITKYSERDKVGNISVICPEHGIRIMRYWNLKNGEGCYKCSMEKMGRKSRVTNEEIIRRSEEMYGDIYTYEKLDTQNRTIDNKVTITCKKHGDFLVSLTNFLSGKSGCPTCRNSKLEMKMKNFLLKNNIKFEQQKTFIWLKYKSNLYLDFYLPDYNIAIECQGKQHFHPIEVWGGESGLIEVQKRDKIKKELCLKNGIKILYFMESKYKLNENDYSSTKKILGEIK